MADDDTTSTDDQADGDATSTDSTTTSTDVGDAGKRAIDAERAKAREATKSAAALKKANTELENRLKALEDRDKTEAQKLADGKAAAEKAAADSAAEVAKARTELLRMQVAAQHKLPAELAGRLQGETAEEMAEDAKALLKVVGAQAPLNFDGGARRTAKSTDMNQLIRQKAGLG